MEELNICEVARKFKAMNALSEAVKFWGGSDDLWELAMPLSRGDLMAYAAQNKSGRSRWTVVVQPAVSYAEMHSRGLIDVSAIAGMHFLTVKPSKPVVSVVDFTLTGFDHHWQYQEARFGSGQKRATLRAVVSALVTPLPAAQQGNQAPFLSPNLLHWSEREDGSDRRIAVGYRAGKLVLTSREYRNGQTNLGRFAELHFQQAN